ncbi:phosphonate ABC transporter ATP-binding protein [Bacillus thermotolerans]|uniref:Phosphonate ABC transporter ATP-binding protein n=1 Tax=Bacillus thermotolerans TaxID=1221996 RepID=A0A0F5HYW7_BACTR|nr:phosphonate ABC transporter ATP-binding protein [Bacillus thermotolerans]KKB38042.1 Phosphonate ABC transporter ATP-binding protein [Bacillus thermotolerans]KKB40703.1 Phosphonate ABC transporter ATP-binding protein [Bacillus thermotolerans]
MTTLLELKNVSKYYSKDIAALSNIHFSIEEGEFVSVIGPSGAGKSTLLRCINRMIEASSGEVVFNGTNIRKLGRKGLRETRTQIGMIFQHYNLVTRLTVIENVLHGRLGYKSAVAGMLGIYSQEEKQQAIRLLEELGLSQHMYKRVDQLSGGQKQRVGIARALIQNPKMLLCDEPIASLDPGSSKIIMDHIKNISASYKITCLVNLHQVDVALKYSDRIIGVNKGEVVFNGKPSELTTDMIHKIYGSETGDLIFEAGERNAG